jgi:hypothetical protein
MINRDSLRVNRELAEGSFGSVYSITKGYRHSGTEQNYVYKEYKKYVNLGSESLAAFVVAQRKGEGI